MNEKDERAMELANAIIGCAFAITKVFEENPITEEEMSAMVKHFTDEDGVTDWESVSEHIELERTVAVGEAVLKVIDQPKA